MPSSGHSDYELRTRATTRQLREKCLSELDRLCAHLDGHGRKADAAKVGAALRAVQNIKIDG